MAIFNILGGRGAVRPTHMDEAPLTVDTELAALEENNSLGALSEALSSPRPQVRERAAARLSEMNTADAEVLFALQAALSDNSALVRWRVGHLLYRLGEAAWQDDAEFTVWRRQVLDEVLGGLLGEATDRWVAVETLGQMSLAAAPELQDKVRQYLIAALSDEHAPVRLAAAEALSSMADAATITTLLQQLEDADALKRRSAAVALGYVRTREAMLPLIALLRDSDSSLRLSAAEALGQIADQRALAPLIVALADDELWVRAAAATALGKLGDAQAVTSLLRIVEADESIVVRRAALAALGSLDSYTQARPLLLQLLSDDDALLRRLAAAQVARNGNAEDVAALRPLRRDEQVVFGQTIGEAIDSLSF